MKVPITTVLVSSPSTVEGLYFEISTWTLGTHSDYFKCIIEDCLISTIDLRGSTATVLVFEMFSHFIHDNPILRNPVIAFRNPVLEDMNYSALPKEYHTQVEDDAQLSATVDPTRLLRWNPCRATPFGLRNLSQLHHDPTGETNIGRRLVHAYFFGLEIGARGFLDAIMNAICYYFRPDNADHALHVRNVMQYACEKTTEVTRSSIFKEHNEKLDLSELKIFWFLADYILWCADNGRMDCDDRD